MPHQHHVHRTHQRTHSQLVVDVLVLIVALEELGLSLQLLIQGELALWGTQVDAGVTQSKFVGKCLIIL